MSKKFGFLLTAFVLTLVLVACGGDGDTNDENGYDNGEDVVEEGHVQGVTDTHIYVANSAAASGPLAGVGVPFLAGMDAYFAMVNEGGGIHGRLIERIHIDDEFDPANAIAALETFLYDDEVFALVGHFGSTPIGATWPEIVRSGIPAVYFAGGIGVVYNENATDGDGRNAFPVQPVFPMEGRIFTAWAHGHFDAETIVVIHTDDDAGEDFVFGVTQEAETLGISDNVHFVQVTTGAVDTTAAVAEALGHNPDVIIAGSIQGTIRQIAGELAAQNNTAPVLTSYVNADVSVSADIYPNISGQFEIYGSSWVGMVPEDMEEYQEWVAQVSDEDFSLNSFAMTGWIAAHFFSEGLRRTPADDINWATFIDAMESAPIQNPFGPVVDFANGLRVGTQDLALVRMDGSEAAGWADYLPFMSMDEILAD